MDDVMNTEAVLEQVVVQANPEVQVVERTHEGLRVGDLPAPQIQEHIVKPLKFQGAGRGTDPRTQR